ncbi:AI-2E family transporter [Paracoccus suum]|uniref:AI-2E family transporter n=1 Tax=Paracoccus suum TaxID=2259340 RepID=A0A344PLA7_9RHOB|nr:AI-2E family transporter [Paracoccus suum]AXC50162.1 AI-2E family transporter [Paracoccus suum]
MRIPVQKQIWWWGAVGLLLIFALWRLGNVMTPFLLGAGVAYVLDPVADRLEASGVSRRWAVGLITVVAALAFGLILLLLVPMLIKQLISAVEGAPAFLERLQEFLSTRFPRLLPEGGTLQNAINNATTAMNEHSGEVLSTVLTSLSSMLGVLALLVIVPVVAFYMLLDWDHMVEKVDDLLPREHADTLRHLASGIDESLSGFLRGQGLVTLILGAFYAVSLFAVGLPFGLVIGISAAILSIIPYVGVFIGGVTAIGVATVSFWNEPYWIGVVAAIFAIGQFVEGNYLQPKIIGGHVGLHPVWLMIALSVFGTLFGFVGLIVAVPLAAMVGVVARFMAARYKEGAIYTGREVPPPPQQPTLIELVPRGTVAEARRRAEDAKAVAVAEVRIEDARREALRVAEETAKATGATAASAAVAIVADPRVTDVTPEVVAVSPTPTNSDAGDSDPIRTLVDDAELDATSRKRRSAAMDRAVHAEVAQRTEDLKEAARDVALAAMAGASPPAAPASGTAHPPAAIDPDASPKSDPAAAAEVLYGEGEEVTVEGITAELAATRASIEERAEAAIAKSEAEAAPDIARAEMARAGAVPDAEPEAEDGEAPVRTLTDEAEAEVHDALRGKPRPTVREVVRPAPARDRDRKA